MTSYNTIVGDGEYRLIFETNNPEFYKEMELIARRCIDGLPAIDAVPVVRCKDCKYYVNYCGEKCCDIFLDGKEEPYQTKPTDFCSYGEREED